MVCQPRGGEISSARNQEQCIQECNLLFMAEVIYRTVKDGAAEDGLYEWCEHQILTLDALQSDFSNFHIYFLLEFCIALGFRPEVADLLPFTDENQAIVAQFMRSDLASAMLIPLTGRVRGDIASSIIRYLEFHTESAINIRSCRSSTSCFREA